MSFLSPARSSAAASAGQGHQSGDSASSDFDSLAFEFAGDAFGTVGGVRGVDFSDPLQEFGFLAGSFLAGDLGVDPGTVVAAVGDQYAAQSPQAEPVAVGVNEREALMGRGDQRPRGLPQDLVVSPDLLELAAELSDVSTQLGFCGGEFGVT